MVYLPASRFFVRRGRATRLSCSGLLSRCSSVSRYSHTLSPVSLPSLLSLSLPPSLPPSFPLSLPVSLPVSLSPCLSLPVSLSLLLAPWMWACVSARVESGDSTRTAGRLCFSQKKLIKRSERLLFPTWIQTFHLRTVPQWKCHQAVHVFEVATFKFAPSVCLVFLVGTLQLALPNAEPLRMMQFLWWRTGRAD